MKSLFSVLVLFCVLTSDFQNVPKEADQESSGILGRSSQSQGQGSGG